jgi:hypothetical protein
MCGFASNLFHRDHLSFYLSRMKKLWCSNRGRYIAVTRGGYFLGAIAVCGRERAVLRMPLPTPILAASMFMFWSE